MTSFININYFRNHLFYNYKTIIIFFLGLSIFSNIFSNIPLFVNEQSYSINNTIHGIFQNGIIKENFFIIDSYNLDNISSHMYGFSISNKGIVTDNYYKNIGKYEKPDPQGTFVLIRKSKDIIRLDQDFHGSMGIYIYENHNKGYFAFSNSFLLLTEYLVDKQKLSLNKDFSDNFVVTRLCTPSIYETMIKEITKIPSNSYIIINIKSNSFLIKTIDYKENTIPFETKEGLKIIDKWIDKWGFIIRSLNNKINNIASNLSGGFDTRVILSIFLNSGINLNNILINSATDKKNCHDEDFKIATNISLNFGFKLNNYTLDKNCTSWSLKDTLFCTIYSKLGFHKEFYWKNEFFTKPRFVFTGGGEIRGYPGLSINDYIESIASQGNRFGKEFYRASKRLCERSVNLMKSENIYNNGYKLSSDLYHKGREVNHDGKASLEGFIANLYLIQPLIDIDIRKIKFDIENNLPHDLIAYIYVRFAHDLIKFPIQGNRTINIESIKKAERLNKILPPYEIKHNYNKDFFVDFKRTSPVPPSKVNKTIDSYLKDIFVSNKFIESITKIYKYDIYQYAEKNMEKSNYFPLRYLYGLYSLSKTLDYLNLNKFYLKKLDGKKL